MISAVQTLETVKFQVLRSNPLLANSSYNDLRYVKRPDYLRNDMKDEKHKTHCQ